MDIVKALQLLSAPSGLSKTYLEGLSAPGADILQSVSDKTGSTKQENLMYKKRNLGVFIVLAMIFAMVFTACDAAADGENNGDYPLGATPGPGFYEVGDVTPNGGIIFYTSEEGFIMADTGIKAYYLVVAPDFVETNIWAPDTGSGAYDYVGTETQLGTGRKNTALILAAATGNRAITAPAAYGCATYSTALTNVGDWFLPSRDEISLLYQNMEASGVTDMEAGPWSSEFWTSSDRESNSAFTFDFFGGGSTDALKNSDLHIRPIRAF